MHNFYLLWPTSFCHFWVGATTTTYLHLQCLQLHYLYLPKSTLPPTNTTYIYTTLPTTRTNTIYTNTIYTDTYTIYTYNIYTYTTYTYTTYTYSTYTNTTYTNTTYTTYINTTYKISSKKSRQSVSSGSNFFCIMMAGGLARSSILHLSNRLHHQVTVINSSQRPPLSSAFQKFYEQSFPVKKVFLS